MKLFDDFEAVRFPEENLIFITHGGYLYYIYDVEYKHWRKYRNAGNDHITVRNYDDVSKEVLMDALDGKAPQKETDFMRFCNPEQLCIRDMLDLLREDYPNYMSDGEIYHTTHRFLLESDICYKSYEELKKLFDNALAFHQNHEQILNQVKNLCFAFIGRDIFKEEIRIVDGHDSSSYFWIMPVRVIDYSNTENFDSVAEMRSTEISIEEDDVSQYLTPFLYKFFDDELEANKNRADAQGFEWYLTHNFFTFDSITSILNAINDTIDALDSERDNEFTAKLREKRGTATYQLLYARDMSEDQIKAYNANRPTEDNTEIDLIIDFYRRFVYRMEYMMKVGKEKGYDLISFMGQ